MKIVSEFIDRANNPSVVQIDEFMIIASKGNIKRGDRFICPATPDNKRGIVTHEGCNILLRVHSVSEYHIHYDYGMDTDKHAAIAWDLCYKQLI